MTAKAKATNQIKLTTYQKRVKMNHKRIMDLYDELALLNPDVSINKICVSIADRIGWTREGVRNVVNIYLKKRENKIID